MLSAASGVDAALRYALREQSHCVSHDFTAKESPGGLFEIVIPELWRTESADPLECHRKSYQASVLKFLWVRATIDITNNPYSFQGGFVVLRDRLRLSL